jgi:hypothetical protein
MRRCQVGLDGMEGIDRAVVSVRGRVHHHEEISLVGLTMEADGGGILDFYMKCQWYSRPTDIQV